MITRTIDIPEELARFIHDSVAAGRYPDENEVVRAALHLLEREEEDYRENLVELRAEVQKGIDAIEAGDYIELNSEEELSAYFEALRGGHPELLTKAEAVKCKPLGLTEGVVM